MKIVLYSFIFDLLYFLSFMYLYPDIELTNFLKATFSVLFDFFWFHIASFRLVY